MISLINKIWREPSVSNPPGPRPRDTFLAGFIILLALVEAIFTDQITWRVTSTVLISALAFTLPWRRIYPLLITVVAFASTAMIQATALINDVHWLGLKCNFYPLILTYTLVRWASGKHIFCGLIVAFSGVYFTVTATLDYTWLEYLGASVYLLVPAIVAASIRLKNAADQRAKEHIRLAERDQLARQLHDTVAHHVSAIAIQAQAGLAQAQINKEAPLDALKVIEEAASRTLAEMRLIVSALREDGLPDRSPSATLKDIKTLALNNQRALTTTVTIHGILEDVDTALASTLYRISQEAITNANRHAVKADRLSITISGNQDTVHLIAEDDGKLVPNNVKMGLGLQGMTERVKLLGGSLDIGPSHTQGWKVEVSLPKKR